MNALPSSLIHVRIPACLKIFGADDKKLMLVVSSRVVTVRDNPHMYAADAVFKILLMTGAKLVLFILGVDVLELSP